MRRPKRVLRETGMERKPLVSVIVPVYNAERYLTDCLRSLLGQTETAFEIILIDDGSTDGSAALLLRCAQNEPRIVYRRVENGGPSRARNLGIDLAAGRYLCFVDADDFVAPDFLERLLAAIGDADACVCAKTRWKQKQNRSRIDRCPDFTGDLHALKKRLFRYRRVMRGVTGRLYRADVVRENRLRFDEALRYGEDMTFNYLVFRHAKKVVFLNRALYTYRIDNAQSLTRLDKTAIRVRRRMQNDCIRSTFDKV